MIFEIFQYSFITRAFIAGIIVAIAAPIIGIFLVLRRYSLIADTLSHVSLAGIALGLFFSINPVLAALFTTVVASFGIEKLRGSKKVYGESALALFTAGGLALAIVLFSLARGFNTNIFDYLFGSIVTVTQGDIYMILALAVIAIFILAAFYKDLVYISFDEDAAQVSGINTKMVNNILIILTGVTIALSLEIIGVLLIAALIVIPVVTALQFKKSFAKTIFYAEIISILSVISGIIVSFYFNLSTGGTVVLIMLLVFIVTAIFTKKS